LVGGLLDATQVAAGESSTCTLLADGTVSCWGSGATVPEAVSGLANIVFIDEGGPRCALARDGSVRCWGGGLFGNGQLSEVRATPTLVSGLNNVGAIATGGSHTCVVRTDATMACWGSGQSGQLGQGDLAPRTTPTEVPDAIGWAVP
jgi:alpha-tubulin suppressor-like RCC1 family protein